MVNSVSVAQDKSRESQVSLTMPFGGLKSDQVKRLKDLPARARTISHRRSAA
jgi:hypothetical protein